VRRRPEFVRVRVEQIDSTRFDTDYVRCVLDDMLCNLVVRPRIEEGPREFLEGSQGLFTLFSFRNVTTTIEDRPSLDVDFPDVDQECVFAASLIRRYALDIFEHPVCSEVVTVELTGTEAQVDDAIDAFERFGVREVARTGTAALAAGTDPTA